MNAYANKGGHVWASLVTSPIDLLTQQNLFLFLDYDVILLHRTGIKAGYQP